MKRASDLTARSLALAEIQESLDLPQAPLRIECIDVSHVQGTNVVGSLVVFEDGIPKRSDYRRFVISAEGGRDDTLSVAEVVRRRFARYLRERSESGDGLGGESAERPDVVPGARKKFAYPPNLLVVDGGAPQVEAAQGVLEDMGIEDIAVVGLAKRMEEIWVPGQADPVILARTSEALYLLQRIRDEAHRFAITHHRQRRSKSMLASLLDDVPGLGEVRRKALLTEFGSLRALRAADVDQVAGVPGVGPKTAEAVVAALAEDGGAH